MLVRALIKLQRPHKHCTVHVPSARIPSASVLTRTALILSTAMEGSEDFHSKHCTKVELLWPVWCGVLSGRVLIQSSLNKVVIFMELCLEE